MGFELDWMEREERYRRRVVRMLLALCALVGIALGVSAYYRAKHVKAASLLAARNVEATRADREKRERDAFVADSTAAATRLAAFLQSHGAQPMTGLPIVQVPLPRGVPIRGFVDQIWGEYARLVAPHLSQMEQLDWFKRYYVDVMNEGPLRPRAVLLPLVLQDGTALSMKKPNFDHIAQAQREVGMREALPTPAAGAGADTTGAAPAAAPPTATRPAATPPAVAPPAVAPPAVAPPAVPPPAVPPPAATPPAAPQPPAAPAAGPADTMPPAATPPAAASPPPAPPAAPESSAARRDSTRSERPPQL